MLALVPTVLAIGSAVAALTLFYRDWLTVRKLRLEIQKLKEELSVGASSIVMPSLEDISRYGRSLQGINRLLVLFLMVTAAAFLILPATFPAHEAARRGGVFWQPHDYPSPTDPQIEELTPTQEPHEGRIGTDHGVDWYRLRLEQSAVLELSIDTLDRKATKVMGLFGPDDPTTKIVSDGSGVDDPYIKEFLERGTYYVAVSRSKPGEYWMFVRLRPPIK